ncbi:SIR2 family protein [Desulfosporosinus sp. FKB]|uniref:SIR2 family protein n=1 Tax=Desulfosporosinus sp. FKB TaxID=1969835 RepID=UPI000B49B92D|nr:SIR2 family protein [Desulfosporosinus sp. FKB]
MDQSIQEFIRTYSRAIEESNAAIFAGAGLSKPAGYVNWKELLRDVALDLNLDVEKESDLIAIAQYHVNENGGRGKINQVLLDEFTKDCAITKNHEILSRLHIKTYWTTNYDSLIEESLKVLGKRPDVKRTVENLAVTMPNSDAVVYKMHGDVIFPNDAVLTKDDYEGYNLKRQLFTTALQGDLVSKTFLFIGFSFDDPNLGYILSRIRILLGENQRPHYCFMKRVLREEFETDSEYIYAQTKQDLRVRDLKRYCIKPLLVNEYSEVTEILFQVQLMLKRKNIFISASASDFGTWGQQRVFLFASNLSKAIINNGNDLVTGFGLGVGSCVISGALEEIYSKGLGKPEKRLKARPFPQITVGTTPLTELWTKHRESMLTNVGVAIFIFGNKFDDNGNVILANGMFEEFEISVKNGTIPIPVGVTGFAAQQLWQKVLDNFESYILRPELKSLYKLLGDSNIPDLEIIKAIINIINKL